MSKVFVQSFKSLSNINQSSLNELKEECRQEAYDYFDEYIRSLPKDNKGNYAVTKEHFYDNDVDAFRPASASLSWSPVMPISI